ncbi:hypothetical protein FACS1894132_06060 [Clostridia bacterium]|nr:hypothetical protein FACS1894132_06060 [Clostridia bacterium]
MNNYVRIEITSDGLAGFPSSIGKILSTSDNVWDDFNSVKTKMTNYSGGHLRDAISFVQNILTNISSIYDEKLVTVQINAKNLVDVAKEKDCSVAKLMKASTKQFYKDNTWAKPVPWWENSSIFQIVVSGLEIVVGVAAIVVGVLSIVCTLGFVTPAGIAFIVGGATMITHGSGGLQEGIESVSGSENPRNWLKNAVGETAYNIIGIAGIAIVSVASGPAGILAAIGGVVVGTGASYVAREVFGVNPVVSDWIGLGAGIIAGGRIYKTAKPLNRSINGRKTIEKPTGGKVKVNNIPEYSKSNLPQNAQDAYTKYDDSGWRGVVKGQTEGTKAGGKYKNNDTPPLLPPFDKNNNAITYREFDVNNKIPNATRDGERFVLGSDGSIYYTDSHYGQGQSINDLPIFIKIK